MRATVLLQSALMFVLGAAVLIITWHLAPRSIFTTPNRKLSKPTIRFKIKAWCVQAFHSLCISLLHLLRRMKMRTTGVVRARAHVHDSVHRAAVDAARRTAVLQLAEVYWRRAFRYEKIYMQTRTNS